MIHFHINIIYSVISVLFCVYYFIQLTNTFFVSFQAERTYLQVYLPKESKESSQPMFFCSKWSVGKVVDYAASLASLKNNNNVLTAKVTHGKSRDNYLIVFPCYLDSIFLFSP